jgi:hypothetical protein
MRYGKYIALAVLVTGCCLVATGKNKRKVLLPADVVQAQTAVVLVDPDAGVPVDAPYGNTTAREDVEKALMKWGRFRLVMNASDADLVFVVRKGTGKNVEPTIGGIPQNNRPVIFEPTDSGGRLGGSRGTPPGSGPISSNPAPQVEVGAAEDTFAVYRGSAGNQERDALAGPAVWRYIAKDGLRSPSVPAVDQFKKVLLEAEKQLQDQQP